MPKLRNHHPTQGQLDRWFPTGVRYCGAALMLYAFLIDHGHNPALIPAALGMILYKTVSGGTKGDDQG